MLFREFIFSAAIEALEYKGKLPFEYFIFFFFGKRSKILLIVFPVAWT